jgi:hypothetical protein
MLSQEGREATGKVRALAEEAGVECEELIVFGRPQQTILYVAEEVLRHANRPCWWSADTPRAEARSAVAWRVNVLRRDRERAAGGDRRVTRSSPACTECKRIGEDGDTVTRSHFRQTSWGSTRRRLSDG